MNSGMIRKDVDEFQAAVMRLSDGVGRASVLWSDAKFAELSASVRGIANLSKDVIIAGDACCASINRFAQIAAEDC